METAKFKLNKFKLVGLVAAVSFGVAFWALIILININF